MHDPRDWSHLPDWAASGRTMLGGSPGAAAVHDNRLLYPDNLYTVSTDQPAVRTFDGISDRELNRIPITTASVIPKAVMSMFVANNTIYLSTYDVGTTSTTWAGRVFTIDPISSDLVPQGDEVFAAGQMPYAFAWHLGRIWVGTNRGDDGTAVGRIYWLRPGIDTVWTLDKTLTNGSVTSMHEYGGKLYVGIMREAAAFAEVLVRAPDTGVYSSALTATGGAAIANNAFLAMEVLDNNLYASYWNNDTTAISKVYKFDGTSWTTSLSLSGATARPFMALAVDLTYMYAIGGAKDVSPLLYRLTGVTWENLTAFIDVAYELVPAFGRVIV